jgi:hypothetical protein
MIKLQNHGISQRHSMHTIGVQFQCLRCDEWAQKKLLPLPFSSFLCIIPLKHNDLCSGIRSAQNFFKICDYPPQKYICAS